MKKAVLLALALAFAQGQAQKNFWSKTSESNIKKSKKSLRQMSNNPDNKQLFQLDLEGLKSELKNAPLDNQNFSQSLIKLPNSQGELDSYKVWESPVLDTELAKQFPELKSYVAYAVNNPSQKMRLSISPEGLSAYGVDDHGGSAIEVYTNDKQTYAQYKHSDTSKQTFNCASKAAPAPKNLSQNKAARSNDSRYHTMRTVFSCTGQYASFHLTRLGIAATATDAQKRAAIMGVMQASANAINVIYERDLAIRFILIADNAKAIFFDTTTFNNTNDNNKATGTARINTALAVGRPAGFDANALYDIGHVFSRITSGASGLAYTNNCDDNKADATSGSTSPFGPAFDIDFVCHEMGHQLGADHTMAGNCNNVNGYQYEPGSGTSIMAYAGVCDPVDVQFTSDPLFHTKSIDQIQAYVNQMTCKTTINNNNTAPVVNAGLDYTIPRSTAFVLTGSATDANDPVANLSYSWEQVDSGARDTAPVATQTSGPVYRVRPLQINNPKRFMPQIADVVAGNLTPTWEVTPSVARTLNFTLTARDNRSPNGGQTGKDNMRVTVANVGPFRVTSQTTAVSYNGGTNQTITWDVAGTTANNINTANVKISLSTDGGLTYPTVLLDSTPNDGSQAVALPNIASTTARVKVEAVGNIFYAINSRNFTIVRQNSLGLDETTTQSTSLSPNPNNGIFTLSYSTKSTEPTLVEITDMLGNQVYRNTFDNQPELNENFNLNLSPGQYLLSISDGANNSSKKFIVK